VKGITLFSGIGGVDCGMKWAGIEPIGAVEFDPGNPKYSEAMQRSHSVNFPGSKFLLQRVQDVDWSEFQQPDIVHFSPLCFNFSVLNGVNGNAETDLDRELAIASIKGLEALDPEFVSMEQVPGYLRSKSWQIIKEFLSSRYKLTITVVDCARFRVPQNRMRLIVLGSKRRRWEVPKASGEVGWKEAIAGLKLEHSVLTEKQQTVVLPEDCLIQRLSASKCLLTRSSQQPCWTVLKSHFDDRKGGTRSKVIDCTIKGQSYNLSTRAIARLCGFPDWFVMPEKYAGQGLGYSVPPLLMKQIYQNIP
jgi:DNA (cytosine-5)-methyltransferase 1